MTDFNKISAFFFTPTENSKEAVQKMQITKDPPMAGTVHMFVSFYNLNFDTDLAVKCTLHTPDKTYSQDDFFVLNGFIDDTMTIHLNMPITFDTPGTISATLMLFSRDGDSYREVDNATTYVEYIGKEAH